MSETVCREKVWVTRSWACPPEVSVGEDVFQGQEGHYVYFVKNGMLLTDWPEHGIRASHKVHHTELAAVQDAATRLETIAHRKQNEAIDATHAAAAMRERAKELEGK
jgi:hypothetical protein